MALRKIGTIAQYLLYACLWMSSVIGITTTVDRTLAIIYHPDGTFKVILQSDLRPDLADQVPSLRDVILRELIIFDAQKYKIAVSDAELERHIARIQESLKKSREDLLAFFKERGYTFEQAKEELARGLLIENTVSERVRSKAIVTENERKKFYEEHPLVTYVVKQAFVPFGLGSKVITRATVDRSIETGDILQAVEWSSPITLQEHMIAKEKAFIKELAPGAVSKVNETTDGIALLQLVSRSVVPYEERKQQITMELGMQRQKKAQENYFQDLFAQAKIRYLDKSKAV